MADDRPLYATLRPQLKEENFTPVAATEESIEDLWSSVQEVELLVLGESLRKEHFPHKDKLKRYLEHCVCRHYCFMVMKFGSSASEF